MTPAVAQDMREGTANVGTANVGTANVGAAPPAQREEAGPAGNAAAEEAERAFGERESPEKVLAALEEDIRAAKAEREAVLVELAASRTALAQAVSYLEQLRREEHERTARLKELEFRLDSLDPEIASTSPGDSGTGADNDAAEGEARALAEELKRLRAGIEAAQQTMTGLDERARAAQEGVRAGEDRLEEVKALLTREQEEASRLAERIAGMRQEAGPLEAELQARRDEVARLTSAAEERKQAAAEAQAQLEKARATLEETGRQLTAAETELDGARKQLAETRNALAEAGKQRDAVTKRIAELQARQVEEEKAAGQAAEARQQVQSEVAQTESELSSLQSRLGELREEEGELRALIADLNEAAAALRTGLKADGRQIAELVARRDELLATIRSLEGEASAARESARAIQPSQMMQATIGVAPDAAATGETAAPTVPQQAQAATPPGRAGSHVATALRDAPGLAAASPAELDQLEALLREGACVTDALRDVFGAINRQTLVSLVRDLGGC